MLSFVPVVGVFVFLAALLVVVIFLVKTLKKSNEYVKEGHPDSVAPATTATTVTNVLLNKRTFPLLVLVAVLLAGLGTSLFLVRNQQEVRTRAVCDPRECFYDSDCGSGGSCNFGCCESGGGGFYCGDGSCNGSENNGNCSEDCAAPPPETCAPRCGTWPNCEDCSPPPSEPCSSFDCDSPGFSCSQDGGACTGTKPNCSCTYPQVVCGDGQCQPSESNSNCPADCPVDPPPLCEHDCTNFCGGRLNACGEVCNNPCPTPIGSCPVAPGPEGTACGYPPAGCKNGDDLCTSGVCASMYGSPAVCRGNTNVQGCSIAGTDEASCWAHGNCMWSATGCVPRVGNVSTGDCTLTCGAGSGGVSVSGSGSGCGTVSINWFASKCNSGTGLCGGASTNTTSSLPFSGSISGSGCDYQAEVFATSGGRASCSAVDSGSNCVTTTTPTPPPTPPGPVCNGSCTGTGQGNCQSGQECIAGVCRNPQCAESTACVCSSNNAACNSVIADKSLSTIVIGDTVTFTGYGWVSSATDTMDLINFIVTRDGVEVINTDAAAVRAPEKDIAGEYYYKANYSYTVSSAGNYQVKVRSHWVQGNVWKD